MLTDEEIMAQVLAAFQEEEAEHRQAITDLLLELEREPEHPKYKEMLDQLFREAHSLKGGARAAGLDGMEQVAHRIEDIFSAVRQGKVKLTPDVCDIIYDSIDTMGSMMSLVSDGQTTGLEPSHALLASLSHVLGDGVEQPAAPPETSKQPAPVAETRPQPVAEVPPAEYVPETMFKASDETTQPGPATIPFDTTTAETVPQQPSPPPESLPDTETAHAADPQQQEDGARTTSKVQEESHGKDHPDNPDHHGPSSGDMHVDTVTTVRLATTTLDNLLNETGELITCSVRAGQRSGEARTLADIPMRWRRVWRQVRPVLTRLESYTPAALQPTVHHLSDRISDMSIAERAARILEQGENGQVANLSSQLAMLLDALHQANSLITELEHSLGHHSRQMTEDYTRLSTVTDRLHSQIRRTRMLPLSTLFSPLRLQVREIARAANKQVDLDLDDGGAEADRQVLERLREVLLHLLRNAIDHGIETPEGRRVAGKPAMGCITLRASVSGDYLSILVQDDGSGLDLDAIRKRALSGGVLGEGDMSRMTETELIDLIFLHGFSTRQSVSKMSGRGVGLDVVRSQVERMHGRVNVQSTLGVGCVFTISVPLSLTSSHGLLLRIDQATYMLPLDSVQRIVSVAPSDIKILEGRACLLYDNRPLALVHMADLIGKGERSGVKDDRRLTGNKFQHALNGGRLSTSGNWSLALLLGSGERLVACMVDAVLGEQELVVYRLPAPLQRVRFIAGATILADGNVVPILDVVDLVRAAIGSRYTVKQMEEEKGVDRRPTVLVVDDSITTRTLEKNILEAAGYEVKLATDGAEALETLHRLFEDGGCDLLLSDIDMPRLNGFDLTSQVRADTMLKNIPIVLVTSLDTPSDRERGISAGADAYIVKKAFDQQNLLDTIEQLL